MQVYGDFERTEDASGLGAEIMGRIEALGELGEGLDRHQALVAAFVRAGELVQGVADAEFAQAHTDDLTYLQDIGAALLLALAKSIAMSWDSGFAESPGVPRRCLDLLSTLASAGTIKTRQAEGYAFYALYPETYLVAARNSGLGPGTVVIGIRSIGTGLAALVAAGLGAAAAVTLRPVGHPFDRRVAVGEQLAARLLGHKGAYAIVDEGPGLSGSSFNGVGDWLVEHGVRESQIHFFPSHGGDLGREARPDHRRRWSKAQKHFVPFETLLEPGGQCLTDWISARIGPLDKTLHDVSGGGWRALRQGPADWPPADTALEKRKFLAVSAGKPWLAKFCGIGSIAQSRFDIAKRLAAAGFAPQPVPRCHGFLIMPWVDRVAEGPAIVPLDRLLDYLALRARLPATSTGAGLRTIFDMAVHNLGERLGEQAALAISRALGDPDRFAPVPCCTDNRMHAWEWVETKEGWLKLDGIDHHGAHDLVGCQDIAWDLAGAVVELGLTKIQSDSLRAELSLRIGRELSEEFVAANLLCYIGFQIGLWTMALSRAGDHERSRIERQLTLYQAHWILAQVLGT